VVALFGMLELVFVKTIAWFKQMEIVSYAAGGFDVKSTTKFCPHTPTLLTINKIASERKRLKNSLCVKVCKKPKIRELIYENERRVPKICKGKNKGVNKLQFGLRIKSKRKENAVVEAILVHEIWSLIMNSPAIFYLICRMYYGFLV